MFSHFYGLAVRSDNQFNAVEVHPKLDKILTSNKRAMNLMMMNMVMLMNFLIEINAALKVVLIGTPQIFGHLQMLQFLLEILT